MAHYSPYINDKFRTVILPTQEVQKQNDDFAKIHREIGQVTLSLNGVPNAS